MDVFLSFLETEIPLQTSLHFRSEVGNHWCHEYLFEKKSIHMDHEITLFFWEQTMQMYGKYGGFPLVIPAIGWNDGWEWIEMNWRYL